MNKYLDVSSSLNCLIINPQFSPYSYWNLNSVVRLAGYKAYAMPLGLLTATAIMPQHWNFRFVDLNIKKLEDKDLEWSDLVCVGGMIPQYEYMINLLDKVGSMGKFRVAGGSGPTFQENIYEDHCEVLLLGEGESCIPKWIESCKMGKCTGIFVSDDKPSLELSPIPRYDLINVKDYFFAGIQFSRGCPNNCEFCSITQLWGRKVRKKTMDQFLAELECLYNLGFRGKVDIVDDNLGGNISFLEKEFLPRLLEWMKEKNFPFTFSTELTLNIADNEHILSLLSECRFEDIFVGIESPEREVLIATNKKINTTKPIKERVANFYKYGIVIHSGFILGFDKEKDGMDKIFIEFIKNSGIMLPMMGLLMALPKTDLYNRLKKEDRLFDLSKNDKLIPEDSKVKGHKFKVVDSTTGGLNFKTLRDRNTIYQEFINVITEIYSIDSYIDRIVRNTFNLNLEYRKSRKKPSFMEIVAFIRICIKMSFMSSKVRKKYWSAIFSLLKKGPRYVEIAMHYISLYPHFKEQTSYAIDSIRNIQEFTKTKYKEPKAS